MTVSPRQSPSLETGWPAPSKRICWARVIFPRCQRRLRWAAFCHYTNINPTVLKRKRLFSKIQLWNNIISICFTEEEYTKSWRETFSKEFEGIYQRVCSTLITPPPPPNLKCWLDFFVFMYQESARKQIEYYCSEIENLENSAPFVAAIIEKCALEAVPSLCQVGPGTKARKCAVTCIAVALFSMFCLLFLPRRARMKDESWRGSK